MSTTFSIDLARAVMDARAAEIAADAKGRRQFAVRRRQRRAQQAAYRTRLRLLQAG